LRGHGIGGARVHLGATDVRVAQVTTAMAVRA
jgi:hypothetical protein